jgi:N-acetylmuramoyl-L-alanine amidase
MMNGCRDCHGPHNAHPRAGCSSGQTIYEKDETLPVELDAMALLRARGFTVVVSRTDDNTVARPGSGDVSGGLYTSQGKHDDVAARDVCANMAKADVLVGIYFDAAASDYAAGSVTGYDTARSFSVDNLRFATLVQNDVLAAMKAQGWAIPNEGVVDDTALGGPALTTEATDYDHLLLLGPTDTGWFSTPSAMPGALIVPLFITDPFEDSLAASTKGQKSLRAVSPKPSSSTSAYRSRRDRLRRRCLSCSKPRSQLGTKLDAVITAPRIQAASPKPEESSRAARSGVGWSRRGEWATRVPCSASTHIVRSSSSERGAVRIPSICSAMQFASCHSSGRRCRPGAHFQVTRGLAYCLPPVASVHQSQGGL